MNAYGADAETPAVAGKVDFAWLSQAFKLFGANAGLWISASLIAVGAPLVFSGFVLLLNRVSAHVAAAPDGHTGPMHLPLGVPFAIGLIDMLFCAFITAGIAQMAVRKVSGQPISGRDIFGGARSYPTFLLFIVLYSILVSAASLLLVVGGVFMAGLLLPAFAMVADGEPAGSAIAKSFKAMSSDRFVAAGFAFVLGIIVWIGSFLFGIGLPIFLLVSALAYRDMAGLKNATVSGPDRLPWETPDGKVHYGTADDGSRVSLTGEPLDESGNPIPPARS